jgi:hypothetical protein
LYRDTPTSPTESPSPPSTPSSRELKERKHTTDQEKQLLLEYYDKFGTNTTSPEYSLLQSKLGWDHHRTKIWLYNRKTYHQKPTGVFEDTKLKRRKRQKLSDDDDENYGSISNNNNDVNSKEALGMMQDYESEEDLMFGGILYEHY